MSSLGASISAGDGGARNIFLPANGASARRIWVNLRLSLQKQFASPHSARVPALSGEKYEVTKEDGSPDSPALNGTCPRGKAEGRAGWCLRKSSVDPDRPRPALGKGRGLRRSPAPEAPQGMGRPTGPTEAGVGGGEAKAPALVGESGCASGLICPPLFTALPGKL